MCVHNAGRSQMAALLTAHLSGGRVDVRSAGSDPADRVNPLVVEAMAELGLDMSEEFPKPLTDEVVRAADAVITMGCGDACPIYPGKRYEDWELADPADAESIEAVRAIRDEIRGRVTGLLDELGVPVVPGRRRRLSGTWTRGAASEPHVAPPPGREEEALEGHLRPVGLGPAMRCGRRRRRAPGPS